MPVSIRQVVPINPKQLGHFNLGPAALAPEGAAAIAEAGHDGRRKEEQPPILSAAVMSVILRLDL